MSRAAFQAKEEKRKKKRKKKGREGEGDVGDVVIRPCPFCSGFVSKLKLHCISTIYFIPKKP